jgi:hypothetical protein
VSDPKPPRTPAGDLGTADRVECDHGHYWVRLVTRQAIVREGECLSNCCRGGSYSHYAGSENPTDDGLWSLRGGDGISIALAEVSGGDLDDFLGPQNNQASGLAYRQLRHLKKFLAGFGGTGLHFYERKVVEGPDRMTYRPDKAPKKLQEAIVAKEKAEREASEVRWAESQATVAALYEGGTQEPVEWCTETIYLQNGRRLPIAGVEGDWLSVQPGRTLVATDILTGLIERMVENLPDQHKRTLLDGHDGLAIRFHVAEHARGLTVLLNDHRFFVGQRHLTHSDFVAALRNVIEGGDISADDAAYPAPPAEPEAVEISGTITVENVRTAREYSSFVDAMSILVSRGLAP